MKHIPKYIIATSVVVGLILVLYFTSSQSDEVKKSVSQSGIDGNTGKQFNTASQSGNWDNSPFGSGKPDTEEEKKPVFKKPNTEWKTRTLNINGKWLTYEFGKGNPNEVALSKDEIAKLPDLAKTQEVFYMSPEAEVGMKNFLESSDLTALLEKCHEQLAWSNAYPGEGYTFPHDLSMENMMYVDIKTGRKRFNLESLRSISTTLAALQSIPSRRTECLTNGEYSILNRTMDLWTKTGDGIRERLMDSTIPIIRVPGPETNSPRPSWYNSGTPNDGDITPIHK